MEWTRGELGATERRFLGKLPLTLNDDDRLYVHAEASSPKSWRYVTSVDAAAKSIIATTAQITILRSRSPAGALQHVGNRENYGVHAQHGRDHPIARWTRTAVAGGARLGGAAPRRKSGRFLCHAGYRKARTDLLPRAVRCGRSCRKNSEKWPTDLVRRPVVGGRVSMVKPFLDLGATIDGFRIEECLHQGGMATLWRVSRPGTTMPMLMKVPRIAEGEDPAAIVSFEMEQMILPRLSGVHVPKFIAAGDFAVQPYIVVERIPGNDAVAAAPRAPVALCGGCRHRLENRRRIGRLASAACDSPRRQTKQHHVSADRRGRPA